MPSPAGSSISKTTRSKQRSPPAPHGDQRGDRGSRDASGHASRVASARRATRGVGTLVTVLDASAYGRITAGRALSEPAVWLSGEARRLPGRPTAVRSCFLRRCQARVPPVAVRNTGRCDVLADLAFHVEFTGQRVGEPRRLHPIPRTVRRQELPGDTARSGHGLGGSPFRQLFQSEQSS
jgi:hypothetical protein